MRDIMKMQMSAIKAEISGTAIKEVNKLIAF